jgi:DNA-binding MarR family transcriptional regulator
MNPETKTRPAGADSAPLEPGTPGFDAWRNLIRSYSRLMGELDREMHEAHNFSLGEFDVLVNLEHATGRRRRMCDLAEAIVLSASGLSRRVDRLERAGYVSRRRSAEDGRSIEAAITPAGRRFYATVRKTHLEAVKRHFTEHFSEAELEILRDLLERTRTAPKSS